MTTSFGALGLMAAALYAFQNLVRYARAKDWNGAGGIVLAAVSGIGVVILAAHGSVTAGLHLMQQNNVLGPSLSQLDWASQVMLGVAVGSGGTVFADFRKAIDNTTTAEKPQLLTVVPAPQPVAEVAA